MHKMPVLAFAIALCCANASAQTVKAKLNHVEIAVRDLDAAKRLYSALGFAVTSNSQLSIGTQNSIAIVGGENYLELATPYDMSLAGARDMTDRLKRGDGAIFAGLQISSGEQAVRDLRAAGLKIDGPTPGMVTASDMKGIGGWWIVSFSDEMASRPLFLIQYDGSPPPGLPPPPNSASSLTGLLVAVNDPEKAAAGYVNIGKVSDRAVLLPEFDATAKEIVLESGSIFLLSATDPTGPTARRLKEQGEGILGVRIAVTDLAQARKQIGEKNVSKDQRSLLVSPDSAAGVWLEFQAAHP